MFIIKTFFVTLRKNRIPYIGFVIFFITASLIVSASVVIGQIFIGEMGQAAYRFDTRAIVNFLLIFTAVMGVRAIFSALSALFLRRFEARADYSFRVNFAKFFLRLPFSRLEKTNSGENLSVFVNDLPQAVQFVSSGVFNLAADFTLLLVVLVYMFYVNWLYTLIFLAAFPVLTVLQILISIPIEKASEKVQETQAKFNAVVNDSLQNTSTVIAYALEEELESRYVHAYKKYYTSSMRLARMESILVVTGFVLSGLPLVALFISSGLAVVNEAMLISEFLVYTGIGMMATGWLMEFAETLAQLGIWMAGAKRLNEFTTGDEEKMGRSKISPKGNIAVAFENVNFAYADEAVLQAVSFEIPQGSKVAIMGSSGSGKSTIIKLLLGLYKPTSGKIQVLGNDTIAVGKYALRNSFAYVPQDSFLFPVSIGENIIGKNTDDISPQEQAMLEKSCCDAGILDFINSLPENFNSILSESAENISGGQRQRIAMARAFYKNAPIVLFDEATSALDPTTEAEILKTLADATKDKTVIMVAHRAAAKAFCDTVITMEGGKIT
ncbi:MAG: ABC transporter ATP-binding protein/permease [Firmicutes bacterium]|nr:ABC transporter ATP-binding protein/permease [Bacillota bacterium]